MDAPDIRYVRSADGIRIAYWAMGKGPARPLVFVAQQASSAEFAATDEEALTWHSVIAADRTVVRYDLRGFGLSDTPNGPESYVIERQIDDFNAVVDRLGLTEFDLWGHSTAVRPTLEIAATDKRVRQAIIWAGQGMQLVPYRAPQRNQAIAAIRETGDDEFWRQNLAQYTVGNATELPRKVRELELAVKSRQSWRDITAMFERVSVFDPARVHVPVLVMHPGRSGMPSELQRLSLERARDLARDLEDSRFHPLPDVTVSLINAAIDEVWAIAKPFLDGSEPAQSGTPSASGFRTILSPTLSRRLPCSPNSATQRCARSCATTTLCWKQLSPATAVGS